MAVYDAQLNNDARATRQYTDLDLFFGRKTSDNDVRKVTDAQAVKRSIRNLVQLNTYEKPFHPEISGGVRELMFENMSPITEYNVTQNIRRALENNEPRAVIEDIITTPVEDQNTLRVTIKFSVRNIPEPIEVDVLLERIR